MNNYDIKVSGNKEIHVSDASKFYQCERLGTLKHLYHTPPSDRGKDFFERKIQPRYFKRGQDIHSWLEKRPKIEDEIELHQKLKTYQQKSRYRDDGLFYYRDYNSRLLICGTRARVKNRGRGVGGRDERQKKNKHPKRGYFEVCPSQLNRR